MQNPYGIKAYRKPAQWPRTVVLLTLAALAGYCFNEVLKWLMR